MESVKNILEEGPLAGKQVMVPITTKAFFAGRLKPAFRNEQEQVLMKMAGTNFVELDRSQAIGYLERQIESRSPKTTTKYGKEAEEQTAEQSSEPALPFFEIREELDVDGREVRAEAVNVVKELEYLQKKEGKVTAMVPMAGVSSELPELDESECVSISDVEYEALSARLEELARLEEQAEIAKAENMKSASKLQSKGWAKGFLNAKPKAERPAKNVLTTDKKVGFHAQDAVSEIPRIGQRSASELKPVARKEIDSQVFSGVIRERPVGTRTESVKSVPQKRLSRFAQERQEQR